MKMRRDKKGPGRSDCAMRPVTCTSSCFCEDDDDEEIGSVEKEVKSLEESVLILTGSRWKE